MQSPSNGLHNNKLNIEALDSVSIFIINNEGGAFAAPMYSCDYIFQTQQFPICHGCSQHLLTLGLASKGCVKIILIACPPPTGNLLKKCYSDYEAIVAFRGFHALSGSGVCAAFIDSEPFNQLCRTVDRSYVPSKKSKDGMCFPCSLHMLGKYMH